MNKKEAEEFKKIFKACSEMAGRTLSDTILDMYIQSFNKTDFQAIKKVMVEFFKCSKFPSVNDILSRIGEKEISPEERARTLAQEVISAIGKFGWCNERDAKNHFGPDWDIITGFQGWGLLCNLQNDDLSTFSAQFRNYAEIRLREKAADEIKNGALNSGDIINVASKAIVDGQIKKLTAVTDVTKLR
jgi:hypothetical protein